MAIDWLNETGLELANDLEAQTYYETHAQEGWPSFSDISDSADLRPLLRYIESAREGETLKQLKQRVDQASNTVATCTDPMRARYGENGLSVVNGKAFDKALVISEGLVGAPPTIASSHALLWLARNVTRWTRPPQETRDHQVEYMWSRLTCFFGGVDDALQTKLWNQISQTAPTCPWQSAVDAQALSAAHKNCGWPVSLSAIPWRFFCSAASQPVPQTEFVPDWMVATCVSHVLRHVRRNRDGTRLRVLYGGLASTVAGVGKLQGSDTLKDLGQKELCSLKEKLRIPPHLRGAVARTHKDAVASAMDTALGMLRISDVPKVRPMSELPIQYLAGPWSMLTPSGDDIGHGLRVVNVMEISPCDDGENGRARPADISTSDLVIEYDWDLDADTSWCFDEFRRQKQMTPDTFPLARPSMFIREAFPHLLFDDDMIDAVIYGDLMRQHLDLSKEFPLLLTLAKEPTMDKATNQGKSTFATALSRVMCPGITMTAMRDSSSAPDIRAMAGLFEQNGTLCVDEFVMPKSKIHFLNRECLQQLCTGAAVPVGKALENHGEVELQHPLMICAKAVELSHDLMNRAVPVYVGELDTEDRGRGELIDTLESGEWSNMVRMSAVAFVVGAGMVDAVREAGKTGGTVRGAWRFRHHLAIASLLNQYETDSTYETAFNTVCNTSKEAFNSLEAHTMQGANSGLLAELSTGTNSSLGNLNILFGDVEPVLWADVYEEIASKRDPVISAGQLVTEVGKALTQRVSLTRIEAISRMNCDQTFRNQMAVSRYMVQLVNKEMVGDGDRWCPSGSNYTFERVSRMTSTDGFVLKLTPNDKLQ